MRGIGEIRGRFLVLCLTGSVLAVQATGCQKAEDTMQETSQSKEEIGRASCRERV